MAASYTHVANFAIFGDMFLRYLCLLLFLAVALSGCRPDKPVADFSVSATDCAPPCPVQFTNLSQGEELYYTWNFGDGKIISGEASPAHTYMRGGEYLVTLSATNSRGTHQRQQTISVNLFPDSVRLIGVRVVSMAGCTDTPDVRFVLEDLPGTPVSRSGMLPNLGCMQLPGDIPPGVARWVSNENDLFFTLFNGAEGGPSLRMYDKRIAQRTIRWTTAAAGETTLTGSLRLQHPDETGGILTLDLTFMGKYE